MKEHEENILEVKMDILIKDFQRFRDSQEQVNKTLTDELAKHFSDDSEIQSRILTTLKWHNAIGSSIIGAMGATVYKLLS